MTRAIIIAAILLEISCISNSAAVKHHHAYHHQMLSRNADEKAPPVNGYIPPLPGRYVFL